MDSFFVIYFLNKEYNINHMWNQQRLTNSNNKYACVTALTITMLFYWKISSIAVKLVYIFSLIRCQEAATSRGWKSSTTSATNLSISASLGYPGLPSSSTISRTRSPTRATASSRKTGTWCPKTTLPPSFPAGWEEGKRALLWDCVVVGLSSS